MKGKNLLSANLGQGAGDSSCSGDLPVLHLGCGPWQAAETNFLNLSLHLRNQFSNLYCCSLGKAPDCGAAYPNPPVDPCLVPLAGGLLPCCRGWFWGVYVCVNVIPKLAPCLSGLKEAQVPIKACTIKRKRDLW